MASGEEPSNVGNSRCMPEALGSSIVHVLYIFEGRNFQQYLESRIKEILLYHLNQFLFYSCLH